MKIKTLLCSGIVLALFFNSGVRPAYSADAPPTVTASTPSTANAKPQLSKRDLNTVLTTFDDYSNMLRKAGYATTINTDSAGKQSMKVSWSDKTGDYGVNLTQIQEDKAQNLTFVAPLSSFVQHPKVPAEVFFKLVEAQDATHGWYFVFNPQLQALFLCRTIPSANITSGQLITELDHFQFAAQLTAGVWNPTAWILKPQDSANPTSTEMPNSAPAPDSDTLKYYSGK